MDTLIFTTSVEMIFREINLDFPVFQSLTVLSAPGYESKYKVSYTLIDFILFDLFFFVFNMNYFLLFTCCYILSHFFFLHCNIIFEISYPLRCNKKTHLSSYFGFLSLFIIYRFQDI
jgi:hypothetical protein